ncbi:peroxiredoxin [Cerasicoccus fimbriatus]|uniref:peroxiredoxin n=1 Tax=Cerasicoccus fimbriatus TaxID=3014554 RepID=UPI0022B43191|nr:peroxiredoxin [Cerasicoccus sp. TK19100]
MLRSFFSLAASLLFVAAVNCSAEELQLGSQLPDVTTVDQDGKELKLEDYADKPFLLVYFYPKADTGGCTQQGCSLRDAYAELTDMGVTVIGVSTDNAADQLAFKNKYRFPFTLVADQDHAVAEAFGVPMIANGKLTARQAYLFKDGKLVWVDKKASTAKQADDVKAAIGELG